MGAAFTLLVLAAISLAIVGGAFALYVLLLLANMVARFIRHEMEMRPKERYFTM